MTVCGILLPILAVRTPVNGQEWVLPVSGDVRHPLMITHKDFAAYPHLEVTVQTSKGKPIVFRGVTLYNLLQFVGAPMGDSTEGKNQTWYVQAEASDGYKVLFALAEIDTSFSKNSILVADGKNGGSLDTNAAPLMIVVPQEQRHGRWIRHLTALRVLRATQ